MNAMGGGDDDGADFAAVSAHSAEEWRTMYIEKHTLLEETMEELEEFRLASKEIEQEMEKELKDNEKAVADLKGKLALVEQEKEEWKSKFMKLQATYNTTTTSLQRELDSLRKKTTEYKAQVRELEMGNDDLERNERYVKSSLAEMEEKYNQATEERIMLEHSLMAKAAQEEEMQRLRDDLRDMSLEVAVLKNREDELRRQLEARSSLGPSPATSPSLQGEQEDSLLQLEDLTVAKSRPAHPMSPMQLSEPSSPAPTPPPKPYPVTKPLLRNSTIPASPSRIPAPRRSVLEQSSASTATVVPRNRTSAAQMMGDLRVKVRALETRLSANNAKRVISGPFSRKKEVAPPPDVENSPNSWVVVSDASSTADSSTSFVKVVPPTPAAARPLSTTSRSSASEYGRGSFDRRRSMEVQSPPTSFTARLAMDRERERPLSQSIAPPRRPSSRLSQLAESQATIRPSESHRFPTRSPTPSFIPKPNTGPNDSTFNLFASTAGSRSSIARSQSVRRLPGQSNPSRTYSNASTSSRPISMPPPPSLPPVPALPKGLERSTGMTDLSSIPSSMIPPSASRIGRPPSSAVGNPRRPASVQAPPRSQTPLGFGRDSEDEMGLGSVKEPLPGFGLGRARKGRSGSGAGRI